MDLLKRRQYLEASTVAEAALEGRPQAGRTRFLFAVSLLYEGQVGRAKREMDAAYAQAWTIRDDLSHLPGWRRMVGDLAAEEPQWAWPRYIILKSVSRIGRWSHEALLALVDERQAATVVEFSIRFGGRHHAERPPLRRRHRVVVFEGARFAVPLLRARLSTLADAQVVHVPDLLVAAERPGQWKMGGAARMLKASGVDEIDKVHLDAEYASGDILLDLLASDRPPRVITAFLFRVTVNQRLKIMQALSDAGYAYQLTHDELVAVERSFVENRRIHAWGVSPLDFDPCLVVDYTTNIEVDLPELITRTFIDNQVRFFITPTDNPRCTRFSIGNQDKEFALSRILEIDIEPYTIHVEGLSRIGDLTSLIRLYAVDEGRSYRAVEVELDMWIDRGEYLRSGNSNKFTSWIPRLAIERTMFGYNPPFLARDLDPAITMERRLGLQRAELYDVDFAIDVVFTWVDGGDPAWQRRRRHRAMRDSVQLSAAEDELNRYESRDEIRYALRSVAAFMPFVRKIFLVTDDQVPEWFDDQQERLVIVDHTEIFDDPANLPTFNSNAIETQLDNIPGLSEHFVYFNDDVMLLGPTPATTFFFANGISKFFLESERSQYGPPSEMFHNSKNAVLNSAQVFKEHFDRSFHQFHLHTPFPVRRSVFQEMKREFAEEISATATHHLRSMEDVAPVSSLYPFYAHHVGASVPAQLRATYVGLGAADIATQLSAITIDRRGGILCINDAPNPWVSSEVITDAVHSTLSRLYPASAPWERSEQ